MSAYLCNVETVGMLAGLADSAHRNNRHAIHVQADAWDIAEVVHALMLDNERSVAHLYGAKSNVYTAEQKEQAVQVAKLYQTKRFPVMDSNAYAIHDAVIAAKYVHALSRLFAEWDYQSSEHPEAARTGWYSWVELVVKQVQAAYIADMAGQEVSGWLDREEVAELIG